MGVIVLMFGFFLAHSFYLFPPAFHPCTSFLLPLTNHFLNLILDSLYWSPAQHVSPSSNLCSGPSISHISVSPPPLSPQVEDRNIKKRSVRRLQNRSLRRSDGMIEDQGEEGGLVSWGDAQNRWETRPEWQGDPGNGIHPESPAEEEASALIPSLRRTVLFTSYPRASGEPFTPSVWKE